MPVTTLDYPGRRLYIEAETDPEQQYRAHACAKEPWTVAFIEAAAKEGGCFWDVGANVGPYTLIALALGLRVVAVEPGYANYARLCHNLALNNLLDKGVFVLAGACGAGPGFEWLQYADLRPGAASHKFGGARRETYQRQRVPVHPLDGLVGIEPQGPHWLKIDVDGTELDVLQGAAGFLREPALRGIVCEMQPDQEAAITACIAEAGWPPPERHEARGIVYGVWRRA